MECVTTDFQLVIQARDLDTFQYFVTYLCYCVTSAFYLEIQARDLDTFHICRKTNFNISSSHFFCNCFQNVFSVFGVP